MREIKFRAWDGKKMFFPSSISWKDGLMWCCDVLGNNRYETVIEKSELMQFTGLKDKNGKEIYEGDILQGLHGEQGKSNPFIVLGPVQFSHGSFEWSFGIRCRKLHEIDGNGHIMWRDENQLKQMYWYYFVKEIEVIGNIHENLETLNKK